jgi:hypothetical protein
LFVWLKNGETRNLTRDEVARLEAAPDFARIRSVQEEAVRAMWG